MLRCPSTSRLLGLLLVLIVLVPTALYRWWSATRIRVPLDIPISLAQGHIRAQGFRINMEGDYALLLAIDGDWDDYQRRCLLVGDDERCLKSSHLIGITWKISNGPDALRVNPDARYYGWYCGYRVVCRELGAFSAQSSGQYVLDLNIVDDGSPLNNQHPQLWLQKVETYSAYDENLPALFLLGAMLVVVGIVLLLVGRRVRWPFPLTVPGIQPTTQPFVLGELSNLRLDYLGPPNTFGLGAVVALLGLASSIVAKRWAGSQGPYDIGGCLSLAAQFGLAVLMPGGLCLMLLAIYRKANLRERGETALTTLPTIGQSFQWAQKLPLGKPLGPLPAFSPFAVLTFAVVWSAMSMLIGFEHSLYFSHGVYIQMQSRAANSATGTSSPTRSIFIRIADHGPGKPPALFLNDIQLAWEDLPFAIQSKLGHPADTTVYVSADDDLAWETVINVVAVARNLGCAAVLQTQPHSSNSSTSASHSSSSLAR